MRSNDFDHFIFACVACDVRQHCKTRGVWLFRSGRACFVGPGWPQHAPKRPRDCAKMALRWPQRGPRRAPVRPQEVPKRALMIYVGGLFVLQNTIRKGPWQLLSGRSDLVWPRWLQHAPKRPPDGPKIPQDDLEMAPKWPQEAPRWPQDGLKRDPRGPNLSPRCPRMTPGYPKRSQDSTCRRHCKKNDAF